MLLEAEETLSRKRNWSMESTYIKDILRLHNVERLDRSRIASSLGVSYSTVTRTLDRVEGVDLDWLLKLEASELDNLIYPVRLGPKVKTVLDYDTLENCLNELKRLTIPQSLDQRAEIFGP